MTTIPTRHDAQMTTPHPTGNVTPLDVVVIGGGQAGLALGYYLQRLNLTFVILDAQARTGDSWRQRYDSLVLFTPAKRDALPGLPFPGKRERYPTKDEVADYLEGYARHFQLPVRHSTRVLSVEDHGSGYSVDTTRGPFRARQLVIATGPFGTPYLPGFADKLDSDVTQLHSSAFRNATQLPPGRVLVVGSGNSGAQIAAELSRTHDVTVAQGRPQPQVPQRRLGRDVFDWLHLLGLMHVSAESRLGQRLKTQDPAIGTDLRALANQGAIRLAARAVSAEARTVTLADGTTVPVDGVVWATGFKPDYGWLRLRAPVLDDQGEPVQQRGVTRAPGLYFLGLPWQRRRGSALLGGVGSDARLLALEIARRQVEDRDPAGTSDLV
ncbi:flavin-containing monooxygenase [Deinococcus pimensis]|uniref:flavin-containing monooxygenase n=1 Tax=Deinococcus pimensis TaxID=309888 RepID=UPI0004AD998C|nr:NAD(P)/FAD-dependent oxidoreductase [Deinococcus pimensis]